MESKWEPRRREIEELYIHQNIKLDEVRYIMENERGFSASKTEYERQLKRWNLRKNQKQYHLKFIKARLQVRQQQGKATEVYCRGVLLPEFEMKKIDRCFVSAVELQMLQRSQTPPEIDIVTPTLEINFITPVADSYMIYIRSRELPWFCFLQRLGAIENLGMIIKMPDYMLRDMISNFCPNPSSLVSTHLLQLIKHLSTIFPVDQDDHIIAFLQKIFCGDYHIATIEFLKLAVYILSNKLLKYYHSDGYIFCNKLLKWFHMGRNYLFVKRILSESSPTIEAFMENVFATVVFDEDEFFLKMFLESGIDPNIKFELYGIQSPKLPHPPNSYFYTPLSYFAGTGNVRLVEMIIDKGAAIELYDHAALCWAAFNGRVEVVELLLRSAATNQFDFNGNDTPLQLAAMAGNLKIAALLLDKGVDINSISGHHSCALQLAIKSQANDLVTMLLDRGANVNLIAEVDEHFQRCFTCSPRCSPPYFPPVMVAVVESNHLLVKRLLQLGADVNLTHPNLRGRTPLRAAIDRGNLEICQMLIEAGADVNAPPYCLERETVLESAMARGNSQIVSLLLEYGANGNYERYALEKAVKLNDVKMVQTLLSAQTVYLKRRESFLFAIKRKHFEIVQAFMRADISAFPNVQREALWDAVYAGDLELVQFLLDLGACPNGSPLLGAVREKNVPIIKALLEAGADCNHNPLSCAFFGYFIGNALQIACYMGSIQLVQYLLDSGADINWPAAKYGYTALQAAVRSGNLELVRFLISQKADVNASPVRSSFGWTALQVAIQQNRVDLAQALLEAGADPNDTVAHSHGQSSLGIAAESGNEFLVRLLLHHGADANWPEALNYDQTALQAACKMGHYQIVLLLLGKGADVNAPPGSSSSYIFKCTALQYAAQNGYLRIVKVLLDAGALVNAREGEFVTAIVAAASSGHIDCLKLLLNAGADITSEQGRKDLRTAMDWARRNGHNAAAKFLKYHQIS